MVPTRHAIEIGQLVCDGMLMVDQGLSRAAQFDPHSDPAQFRLLMSDAGEMTFLPWLMRMLAVQAPNVDIEIVQLPAQEHAEALESGGADLYVGNLARLRGTQYRLKLFDDHLVILCRRDHPWVSTPPSVRDYVNTRHIVVRPPSAAGLEVEDLLALHGVRRRPLILPHFLSLLLILPDTDDISTVTQSLAEILVQRAPLAFVPLPIASPVLSFGLAWHRRQHLEPQNVWLRKLFASARWHTAGEDRARAFGCSTSE